MNGLTDFNAPTLKRARDVIDIQISLCKPSLNILLRNLKKI